MKWQPTLVFLPEKSHGQSSLAVCSPWRHKRGGHNLATEQQQQMTLNELHLCLRTQHEFRGGDHRCDENITGVREYNRCDENSALQLIQVAGATRDTLSLPHSSHPDTLVGLR